MDYFLGVDIGNTKSHAVLADESGRVLGFGKGGLGNHEAIGVDGFRNVLLAVVSEALAQAGVARASVRGMGFGIAGYDWPSDRPMIEAVIADLGIAAPFVALNDVPIGLFAGASEGWGVVVSAGTSSNAWGRDAHDHEGRLTGNGPAFGEYGGGSETVAEAIKAISRAWSLRGEETALSAAFVQAKGATDVMDLLEGLARGRFSLRATDAPLVFHAAAQGDVVAQNIIAWIGEQLGLLGCGIIRQLGLEAQAFEVVMAGSYFKGSPVTAERLQTTISAFAPLASFVRLKASPVSGAVLLGMESAGRDFKAVRGALLQHMDALGI